MKSIQSIKLFALVMLITGAIDSIRNLPTTALFGTTLIFFFVFSAIVFLIPAALVSAELSSTFPEDGGIYPWVKHAFGEKFAFIAIWLQWINTMVWYPTILSFVAGTAAYLVNPALAHNKIYLISIILGTFWVMTLVNLRGLKTSANFASICAVVGMILPMALIIVLAIVWLFLGKPIQIHFTAHNMLPTLHHSQSWIALTAIMTAFLGMELATAHVNHVHRPQKTFPRAMIISVILILTTMILGSLAIAFVLPAKNISLVDGIMQAFVNFFQAYHLSWMMPIITIMILIGSIGGMTNWIISPAKGLLQASQSGYLPKFFRHENSHGVASRLLITQAVLVTFVCLAFLLMPSVNGSYWLLTDLSTQLYMLMYVFMFLAIIAIRYKFPDRLGLFKIPGGKFGVWAIGILGLIGVTITLIVGFLPPSNINVGGGVHYEIIFAGGMIVMMIPAVVILFVKRKHASLPI